MNSAEIDALFAQTLVGDIDADEPWEAVRQLRENGNREIFDRASAWCESDDPIKRARGADVLCQLLRKTRVQGIGQWENIFRDEAYAPITRMLENEQNPIVLRSAIFALGHLCNPEGIPLVLRHQDHQDKEVRFAVACALGSFANDARSVATLVKLTRDSDADVRDWAVFGLGVIGDADTPEIREALVRCLGDANEDVAEEAACGLGKRHDQRVIPKLLAMLDDSELSPRAQETVASLLGLDWADLDKWTPTECRAALADKFNLRR